MTYLSEWLKFQRLKTLNVGEDLEQLEFWNTVGTKVNLCNHFSLKKKIEISKRGLHNTFK